jgi:hypothetical protein
VAALSDTTVTVVSQSGRRGHGLPTDAITKEEHPLVQKGDSGGFLVSSGSRCNSWVAAVGGALHRQLRSARDGSARPGRASRLTPSWLTEHKHHFTRSSTSYR